MVLMLNLGWFRQTTSAIIWSRLFNVGFDEELTLGSGNVMLCFRFTQCWVGCWARYSIIRICYLIRQQPTYIKAHQLVLVQVHIKVRYDQLYYAHKRSHYLLIFQKVHYFNELLVEEFIRC